MWPACRLSVRLVVLGSSSLHKQRTGRLRVFDAMSGCGVRALRYLNEAGADFVLANDASQSETELRLHNMQSYAHGSSDANAEPTWQVSREDANKALMKAYIE